MVQGLSDGGISVYIPPKSVYLKKILCVCSSLVTQSKLVKIYTPPPNQIPGYAPGVVTVVCLVTSLAYQKFSTECASEKILKIGQYLVKDKSLWLTFLGHPVYHVVQKLRYFNFSHSQVLH